MTTSPPEEEVKKAAWDAGYTAGLAWSVAILGRWGEETHAGVLLQESGCTYNDFDKVDTYDRKEVRRIFRTESSLRAGYEARKK